MVQIVGNVSLRELAPNPMVGILGVTLDATASEAIATSLEWPADLLIMDESSGRAMARNLNIRKQYPHLSHPQPAIVPAPRPFATFACTGVALRSRAPLRFKFSPLFSAPQSPRRTPAGWATTAHCARTFPERRSCLC